MKSMAMKKTFYRHGRSAFNLSLPSTHSRHYFRLLDGVWTDVDIKNPLSKMMELLNKTNNRALVQQWGIWIMAKDPGLGLKVTIIDNYNVLTALLSKVT